MSELERTAAHESGHAAVAWMLRRSLEVVSIRPGEHWRGIAIFRGGRSPQADLGKTLADVVLWPCEWRRRFETDLCITLAGTFAEALRPSSGYALDDDDARAEEIVSELVPARGDLSDREALVLTTADRPGPTDEEHAGWLVRSLLNEFEVSLEAEKAAYLRWMELHTARAVFSPRGRRLIEGLIPHLLDREVLSGRAVRQIFRDIERPGQARAVLNEGR
jgi:hypothetical protein